MIRIFAVIAVALYGVAAGQGKGTWTDSADASLPVDFRIQGEYVSDGMGA